MKKNYVLFNPNQAPKICEEVWGEDTTGESIIYEPTYRNWFGVYSHSKHWYPIGQGAQRPVPEEYRLQLLLIEGELRA